MPGSAALPFNVEQVHSTKCYPIIHPCLTADDGNSCQDVGMDQLDCIGSGMYATIMRQYKLGEVEVFGREGRGDASLLETNLSHPEAQEAQ